MNEILKNKKFIFFDIGFTLDKPLSGDWMLINKFYEYGSDKLINKTNEEIIKAKKKAGIYNRDHHLCFTIEDEIDVFKHYYKIISDELDLGFKEKEINDISIDRATNMNNYVIYDDTVEVLKELSKYFELGIISDTWPSVANQLKYLGIYDFFKTYTFSFDLGVFKPNSLMYEDALKKCGYDPKDTVFIDDIIENLEGAECFGITPILITSKYECVPETKFHKINCLSDLIR